MQNANKTAMTYETGPTGDPKTKWTTVISDPVTGVVYGLGYFATEDEGRKWGDAQVNGVPSQYGQGWEIKELDEGPNFNTPTVYGDFGSSSSEPPAPKPKIEVTCWTCGKQIEAKHQYAWFGDELTLEMSHCGKNETKTFSLAQAKELAKIGYMAFLS
jgi:hypothetical protein